MNITDMCMYECTCHCIDEYNWYKVVVNVIDMSILVFNVVGMNVTDICW